jgi:hypothetical protein
MRRFMTAFALLLLLGGCSSAANTDQGVASVGGNSSGAPPASATQQGSTEDQMQKFVQCMRDNGVDLPDPEPGGGFGGNPDSQIDRNSPVFEKAMDACRTQLPGGGDLSKIDPKMIDQLRQLTQCLRDNGVDVPDPDPNSPTLGLDQMQNIDRDSPAFKKAMEACKDKVPGRFGG